MSFYFLFIPLLLYYLLFLIISLLFSYYSIQNLLPFEICARPFFIVLYFPLFCSILLYFISFYPYLSTYKIYIKIRGEDLVPCRGEGSPIPLISRRGSTRVWRGHSTFPFLVLPEVLCLLPCLGPLRTPYYKPARVRRLPA